MIVGLQCSDVGHAALQHAKGAWSEPGRCKSVAALVLLAEIAPEHLSCLK